ncbi:hypothetical protein G5V58_08665 [Nocardioides anomalus]|uniref:Uncharacterized protein n=1 Tax=Nocardioides anomalus TaxID=2712223 RepID=A0A6G6WCF6_9ACTN|nr:hypothetical protein [Nocardioides anomalus]QIG42833.1 hypothetical protein G5V58_08665 [Nocardioides anomalus]
MRARLLLGGLGGVVGLYGAWLLLTTQDRDQLVSAGTWLVGGVVLHDGVLAPLVLLVLFVGGRLLPAAYRAPAAIGLLVLGSLTLLAVPVLGAFGRQVHNPALLDRHYWVGWLVLAALVLLAVVAAGERRRRTPGRATPRWT